MLSLLVMPLAAPVTADETTGVEPVRAASSFGMHTIETIALHSGLGVSFEPDVGFLEQLGERSGSTSTTLFDGLLMSEAVFAKADLADGWEAAEPAITPASQAAAIIAEVSTARLLHDGGPDAQLQGMLYLAAAKSQADFSLVNMVSDEGKLVAGSWSDGSFAAADVAPLVDQYAMLEALSLLTTTVSPESSYSAYSDPAFIDWFRSGARQTSTALLGEEPLEIGEQSAAIRAFTEFRSIAAAPSEIDVLLEELTIRLASQQPASLIDRAQIAGTLLIYGPPSLAPSALDVGAVLLDGHSIIVRDRWTADDIALVAGALKALSGYTDWDRQVEAQEALTGFVAAVLVPAGLSASDEAGALPTAPLPGELMPSGVTYDDVSGQWHATDQVFETAPGLRAATVLMHLAPPMAPDQSSADAIEDPILPTVITVAATEFSLTPSMLQLPGGTEVTLQLENAGQIPHNLRIDELDVFVEADGGAAAEITFTTPSNPGTLEFLCDIPGHADGGMRGEFQVLASADAAGSQVDDRSGSATVDTPSFATVIPPSDPPIVASIPAVILAVGFLLAMLVFTIGLVSFSKNAARQA